MIETHQPFRPTSRSVASQTYSPTLNPVICFFHALVLTLALLAATNFTAEHLIEQYDLQIGNLEKCLSLVEMADEDLLLMYRDLNVNGVCCGEVFITFFVYGDPKPFSDLFRTDLDSYATYTGAQTSQHLDCGRKMPSSMANRKASCRVACEELLARRSAPVYQAARNLFRKALQ